MFLNGSILQLLQEDGWPQETFHLETCFDVARPATQHKALPGLDDRTLGEPITHPAKTGRQIPTPQENVSGLLGLAEKGKYCI